MFKTLLVFLFCFINVMAHAQDQPAASFSKAVELYEQQRYTDALNMFSQVSASGSQSVQTAAMIMHAKSMLALKDYYGAIDLMKRFIELYNNSRYTDEAYIVTAAGYYELNRYEDALKTLITVIENSASSDYVNSAKEAGEKIAVNYIEPNIIENLYNASTGKKVKPFLLLALGKAYEKRGDNKKAESRYLEVAREFPDAEERSEASNLYQNSVTGVSGNKKESAAGSENIIAVMLPLTGTSLSDEGKRAAGEILAGIKYAVYEHNRSGSQKIGVVIKDTEMSRNRIVNIKTNLQDAPQVKAVVGPIFSSEVREALEIFRDTDIPLISPTATDNDLTGLNDNFFQANPPFGLRGKIMAQYIYYVENKRRMGILNAIEGYSPLLASVFREEFEKLGGEIVVSQTYKSNTFSLAAPIAKIAAAAGRLEGLYIPLADKIDAPSILSQLSQHNLDVALYGNQDWLLASGFESAPNLSNKLTFTSDYFIEFNKDDFQQFGKDFFNTTKLDANRNVLYGYDTGKYIVSVLKDGAGSRNAVKRSMESGLSVNGFHNNISFDENRWNCFLNIVRYNEGRFELIDKFKAGE